MTIKWLGDPVGCPCFFSQPLEEALRGGLDGLLPTTLPRQARFPVVLSPYVTLFASQLAPRSITCRGTLSYVEGHWHQLLGSVFRLDFQQNSVPTLRPSPAYPLSTSEPATVYVTVPTVLPTRDVVLLTTVDNGHTHTLTLSPADYRALRAGQVLRKQTSRDARVGGRPHVHDVVISCAASGPGQYASTRAAY